MSLCLLLFSAAAGAQKASSYGPFVIQNSALWLPTYLATALEAHGYMEVQPPTDSFRDVRPEWRRTVDLLRTLKEAAAQFPPGLIQFRAGGDPIFNLKKGEPPRMAVTGTALDAPVIFNLGLIGDAERFSFGEAMALWIHELGHKIKDAGFSQEEIDGVAGSMARWFGPQMEIHKAGPLKVLLLNPVPYSLEGRIMMGPSLDFPPRYLSTFAVIDGSRMTDLSEALHAGLDEHISPRANYLEIQRPLISLIKLKEDESQIELHLEMRSTRFPKNQEHYLASDLGPHFHKSARLILSRDLRSLRIYHYADEPLPRPLIRDAQGEIDAPAFSADHKSVRMNFRLSLKNQTHFHAGSYPTAYLTLHALLDGEPVRLEAEVRYNMKDFNSGMPAEVYKKTIVKSGTLSIDVANLRGKELQIIGMQDRFFTLGAGAIRPGWDEQRFLIKESVNLQLPNSCAASLEI